VTTPAQETKRDDDEHDKDDDDQDCLHGDLVPRLRAFMHASIALLTA